MAVFGARRIYGSGKRPRYQGLAKRGRQRVLLLMSNVCHSYAGIAELIPAVAHLYDVVLRGESSLSSFDLT